MIILDTNVLIEIKANNNEIISNLKMIKENYPMDVAITSISFSEFYYGYLKKSKQQQEEIIEWLREFKLLNTNEKSAKLFAELKHKLEKDGEIIPLFDILISSIVLSNKAILITTDNHFKRIKELNTILLKGQKVD